jgi:GAF domain-containing protein
MNKTKLLEIAQALDLGTIDDDKARNLLLGLLGVSGRHLWLNPDDLEFARALQEENRLEAVKWLCEKARPHTLTPLKDAKDILDAYR